MMIMEITWEDIICIPPEYWFEAKVAGVALLGLAFLGFCIVARLSRAHEYDPGFLGKLCRVLNNIDARLNEGTPEQIYKYRMRQLEKEAKRKAKLIARDFASARIYTKEVKRGQLKRIALDDALARRAYEEQSNEARRALKADLEPWEFRR
jgi:hypothetical protein